MLSRMDLAATGNIPTRKTLNATGFFFIYIMEVSAHSIGETFDESEEAVIVGRDLRPSEQSYRKHAKTWKRPSSLGEVLALGSRSCQNHYNIEMFLDYSQTLLYPWIPKCAITRSKWALLGVIILCGTTKSFVICMSSGFKKATGAIDRQQGPGGIASTASLSDTSARMTPMPEWDINAVKEELDSLKRELSAVRETLGDMQAENASRWKQVDRSMTAMASAFNGFTEK